jgi:predicted nucleotidyltransferase
MTIQKLLQSLVDHNVKFVVIGAWAFPAYKYSRSTYDIDIFYEPTKRNIKNIIQALKKAGYDGIEELTEKQLKTKKILLRQYVQDTDIHPFVAGVEFKEVWKRKKETTIEKVKVFIPSLDHIIDMKRAAGRAKDIADLEVLEKIREKSR